MSGVGSRPQDFSLAPAALLWPHAGLVWEILLGQKPEAKAACCLVVWFNPAGG